MIFPDLTAISAVVRSRCSSIRWAAPATDPTGKNILGEGMRRGRSSKLTARAKPEGLDGDRDGLTTRCPVFRAQLN